MSVVNLDMKLHDSVLPVVRVVIKYITLIYKSKVDREKMNILKARSKVQFRTDLDILMINKCGVFE